MYKGFCQFFEDNEFLSFFRYKKVTAWQETGTHYYLSVFQIDSTFKYSVAFSASSERWIVYWNNDSLWQHRLDCGRMSPHSQKLIKIWGYDSSIVFFDEADIFLRKAGKTTAFIEYPNRRDTLLIEVENQEGKLVLDEKSFF